jgi:hypothetical protein
MVAGEKLHSELFSDAQNVRNLYTYGRCSGTGDATALFPGGEGNRK